VCIFGITFDGNIIENCGFRRWKEETYVIDFSDMIYDGFFIQFSNCWKNAYFMKKEKAKNLIEYRSRGSSRIGFIHK
jgi:hypothetical protein